MSNMCIIAISQPYDGKHIPYELTKEEAHKLDKNEAVSTIPYQYHMHTHTIRISHLACCLPIFFLFFLLPL